MNSLYKKLLPVGLALVLTGPVSFSKPGFADEKYYKVQEKQKQIAPIEIIVSGYKKGISASRLPTSTFKNYVHKLGLVDNLDKIFEYPISKLIDGSYENKELTEIGIKENKDKTYTVNFYYANDPKRKTYLDMFGKLKNDAPKLSFKINKLEYLQFRGLVGLISDNSKHSKKIDKRMRRLEQRIKNYKKKNLELKRKLESVAGVQTDPTFRQYDYFYYFSRPFIFDFHHFDHHGFIHHGLYWQHH